MVMHPSHSPESRPNSADAVSHAVIFDEPRKLSVRQVALPTPAPGEVLVDVHWSGISTGTERLLWTGDMPPFPGLGYPLVPGYESVGTVRRTGAECTLSEGDTVFVPGAQCYGEVRGLFGGTASRLVVPEARIRRIDERLGRNGALLALAATAYHALKPTPDADLPDLIVGHGVLGRLLARLTMALGGEPPVVWETVEDRRSGADGYPVTEPGGEGDYGVIVDASGDARIIDQLMPVLRRQGEIVLAGFYSDPLAFAFPPAFMKEARLRVAAEWQPQDFDATCAIAGKRPELLDGLITHCLPVSRAEEGYRTAFTDPQCLKMILDWTGAATH
jgi:3-hydroxyethyl bacteriochlorophyllide a dehydrogenase